MLLTVVLASGQDNARRTHSSVLVTSSNARVLRGADLYYQHCSVCHGDLATGFAEARLSFPEDHQHCERCHRRSNPPQMQLEAMTWRNAFSLGEAPALVGETALTAFPSAERLQNYLSATMPRPFPGMLSEDEYWNITLFLLEANGLSADSNKPSPAKRTPR